VADGLVLAIKCSLRLLEVAPAEVAVPLFCSIWAGAVIPADYSVQLTGPTGTGKTAIAALIQQHFGPDLDARHLPGS
jgi:ABC-type multidrug transport system fused ATPase/permease subunit